MITELLEQIDIMEQDCLDTSGRMIKALDRWDDNEADRLEREHDRIVHNIRNRERAIIKHLRKQLRKPSPLYG